MSCTHEFVDCEHYKYVQCLMCGTLKSTAPDDPTTIYTDLYWSGHRSTPEAQIHNVDVHLEHGVTKTNYLLSQIRCKRVAALEIGCFPGIFLKRLVEYGFAYVLGVDAIAIPQRIFYIYGITATTVKGYFPGVELESSSFDLVSGSDVFEHTAEPKKFLDECFRVCRPQGQLLLVTPLVHNRVVDPRMICPSEHVYIHSKEDAKALTEDAGFSNVIFTEWASGHDVISARK